MRNIAFILAGGTGSRVGGETPKQFLPLADGRSVLEHSVDAFEQCHYIHEIVVVMHPEWMVEAQALIVVVVFSKSSMYAVPTEPTSRV